MKGERALGLKIIKSQSLLFEVLVVSQRPWRTLSKNELGRNPFYLRSWLFHNESTHKLELGAVESQSLLFEVLVVSI